MDKLIRIKHDNAEALEGNIVIKHLKHSFPDCRVLVETRPNRFACYPAADELVDMARFDLHGQYETQELILREPDSCDYFPATKAARAVAAQFHIVPKPHLFKYEVKPSDEAVNKVATFVEKEVGGDYVVCHFEGSGVAYSDLEYDEQYQIIQKIQSKGFVVVLLNWREAPFEKVVTPKSGHWLWNFGKIPDLGVVYELIRRAKGFWGIDAYPAKLAGATDTPANILHWGTSPVHSFIPCANITHHIPDFHDHFLLAEPVTNGKEYLKKYKVREYRGQLSEWINVLARPDEPVNVKLNVNINGEPINTEESFFFM